MVANSVGGGGQREGGTSLYTSCLFFKICPVLFTHCSPLCFPGLPSPLKYDQKYSSLHLCLSQWWLYGLLVTSQLIFYSLSDERTGWVHVARHHLTPQSSVLPLLTTTWLHTSCIQSISTVHCHQLKLVLFLSSLRFQAEKREEQISPSLICSGNYWKSPTEREALAYQCGMTYSHTGPDKRRPRFSASLFRHV